ncbi:MAG TPA: sigma-54 dependent transcriptional regulator [Myxococcota bacterium]|nr:sigma-54 dependent transcriptional regulator [Myxococcota bacterium]
MTGDKEFRDGSAGPVFATLVVDDEVLYARAIARALTRNSIRCDLAHSAAEAVEKVRTSIYDVILLDHKLPDGDGIELIPPILVQQKTAAVIVMTAFEAIPNAIQAIRNGAEDYRVKQTSTQPLVDAVLEIMRRRRVYRGTREPQSGLTGSSPQIQQVVSEIAKVAPASSTVLLTGETGSGKEVAAREIHRRSGRDGKPFVAVDCASIPGSLIETILFGHERGAFTGADQLRNGAFFEAASGTVFLDEIGEMPPDLQARLLRVIESRTFKRVGSVRELPMNARIVAATNRDLNREVEAGRFRFDLFQRLSVFPIRLPPLRERGQDILILAGQFLSQVCSAMAVPEARLSREAEAFLTAYDFPGNVRELKNIIERAVILTDTGTIEPRHLPERMLGMSIGKNATTIGAPVGQNVPVEAAGALNVGFVPGVDTLEGIEEKLILAVLEKAGGNRSEAARMLGISRFALLRRLEKIGSGRTAGD